jgi:hypothetical protein
MKAIPSNNLLENIRSAIRTSKERLEENKQQRKALITKISRQKLEIRTRESLISTLQNNSAPATLVELTRQDLKKQFHVLGELRQHMLVAETFHAVERAGLRALHDRLDHFNAPFDPSRATKRK